jgi:predicted TIM-barrel fold metal-dependent hydrolase
MDQYQEFFDLLERYPNLYLDTTMTLAAFFKSFGDDEPLVEMMRSMLLKYSDRVLYGTDWPNIPYDWCRELANLVSLVDGDGEATNATPLTAKDEKGKQRTIQGDTALERILWRNASRFYGISEADLGLSALASL